MSKIIRVQDGDYKVVTGSGRTIAFDTGGNSIVEPVGWSGGVIITGDLVVYGNTTTLESEELYIEDNIIHINVGDPGPGVSGDGTSGIQISRQSTPPVSGFEDVYILWSENLRTGSLDSGTFVFADGTYQPTDEATLTNALKPIATNGIDSANGNLLIDLGSNGILKVSDNVTLYEYRVLDYNKLNVSFNIVNTQRFANKATITVDGNLNDYGIVDNDFVDVVSLDYSFSATLAQINVINSTTFEYSNPGPDAPSQSYISGTAGSVVPNTVYNKDTIPNMQAVVDYTKSAIISYGSNFALNSIGELDTRITARDIFGTGSASNLIFEVDGAEKLLINEFGLHTGNLRIDNSSIGNYKALGENNVVELDSFLSLQVQSVDATTTPSGYIKLYAKNNPGQGDTGVFFKNTAGTSDELISKTKAVIYSLIL